MQDQHFIRDWTEAHRDFTADLHQTMNQLGRYQRTRDRKAATIGSPYDRILDRRRVEPSHAGMSPAAQASLRGLAASAITVVLWAVVVLIAMPAPGFAAPVDGAVSEASECVIHPVLA